MSTARSTLLLPLAAVVGMSLAAGSGPLSQTSRSAEPPDVRFTKGPTAVKAGDRVRIEFAVNRETDVAVFIDNDAGAVVRHLVAGVLGKNPPLPLRANPLEQSLVWDGRDDDGKPAAGGPFRVRVALGT